MLKAGDKVPGFSAETTEGHVLSDASLRGRPFVLFFFPRAFTPGCVRETKAFRDAYPALRARGVEVVGVSTDSLDTQCAYSEWAGVAFPMIGDPDRSMAKAFGVLWPLLPFTRRATFVVDAGGVVRAALHYELAVERHVAEVERVIAALTGASG